MRDAWERLPKKGGNMEDCIFCKLANGEIPTDMVYEDDRIACFRDADPQAPVHVLMVPKRHIPSLDELTEEDSDLLGYMMIKIKDIAAGEGLENGYRAVINCGEDGQQTVKHLHIHILGKRKMTWPPG
jgi:histidine triad (HIT) family protein